MDKQALLKISYGLFIVSAKSGKDQSGFISNSVMQVSGDPIQVSTCSHKNNFTTELIRQSGYFSISILKKETKSKIMGDFGFRSGKDTNKFDGIENKTGQSGTPVVTEDTIATLECKVTQTIDVGTHLLFIAELIDSTVLDADAEVLGYQYYRDHKNGIVPEHSPTYQDDKTEQQPVKEQTNKNNTSMTPYQCEVCGYIYNPEEGDPAAGIAPGTSFEDLPDDWTCPLCGAGKDEFFEDD